MQPHSKEAARNLDDQPDDHVRNATAALSFSAQACARPHGQPPVLPPKCSHDLEEVLCRNCSTAQHPRRLPCGQRPRRARKPVESASTTACATLRSSNVPRPLVKTSTRRQLENRKKIKILSVSVRITQRKYSSCKPSHREVSAQQPMSSRAVSELLHARGNTVCSTIGCSNSASRLQRGKVRKQRQHPYYRGRRPSRPLRFKELSERRLLDLLREVRKLDREAPRQPL